MKPVNIHATCIRLARAAKAFGASPRAGVLLLGDSGSGKSDLALRLIERGAVLVADDRTDLVVERGRLSASAPRNIAGLIEIRGIGIVTLPYTTKTGVVLAVKLTCSIARMPVHIRWQPPETLKISASARPPLIAINPFEDSAPAKIVAAAAAFAHDLFREEVKRH